MIAVPAKRFNTAQCPRVVVVTHFTSPYQVELFDAVAASKECDLQVLYLFSSDSSRSWRPRRFNHEHQILGAQVDAHAERALEGSQLAVFNFYQDRRVAKLMQARSRSGKPWCFWGERPGYRGFGWLGRAYRRHRLAALRKEPVPIWGIGTAAVDAYRQEFGSGRQFVNLPYYSDLARFGSALRRSRVRAGCTTFLYAGSLIQRKGVDLLARAFLALLREHSDIRLRFVGEGQLRPSIEKTLGPAGNRVEFTGFRDWDALAAVYRDSDVACVPSRYDGWGLVVPEALASGVPVIATDRTGSALDLISHRRNGWMTPANQHDALLAAMKEAVALTDDRLGEMSRAAVASVATYGLEEGTRRFLGAVRDALESWESFAR